jgi:hypothetical protein
MPATNSDGESQGIRSRPATILHSDENPVKLRCECRLRKVELEYIHICAKELPNRTDGSFMGCVVRSGLLFMSLLVSSGRGLTSRRCVEHFQRMKT